jgi:MtfA peptidase
MPSVLDAYGATNEAEFFAVATETFFTRPFELKLEQPALYAILADFYRQSL